ncbi:MAG: AAA family ATPase [Noviherbaspirillum sp.]
MNARDHTSPPAPTAFVRFVFCSSNSERGQWLAAALNEWDTSLQKSGDLPSTVARIAEMKPELALLDFSGEYRSGALSADVPHHSAADAIELAQALAQTMPDLPLLAVGSTTYPEGAIAALRAGVRDFIDVSASERDAREIVRKVLAKAKAPSPAIQTEARTTRGKLVTLLGARAGVGTSTLAAHLADMAQKRSLAAAANRIEGKATASRVALLDLGLPAGDGQLYLGAAGNFHFVDAVHNVRRFDETLVHTALPRSRGGVTVISLPRNLAEMRTVAHAEALALLERLRSYFDVLIADLGGFSNIEFVAGLANAADEAWLVTDQSVGGLVSLASILHDLDKQESASKQQRLIVSRYDERYGMPAAQIAERFHVPLLATLPERTLGLMSSANQGKLLHQVARRDPYVRAVEELVDALVATGEEPAPAGGRGRWVSKLIAWR